MDKITAAWELNLMMNEVVPFLLNKKDGFFKDDVSLFDTTDIENFEAATTTDKLNRGLVLLMTMPYNKWMKIEFGGKFYGVSHVFFQTGISSMDIFVIRGVLIKEWDKIRPIDLIYLPGFIYWKHNTLGRSLILTIMFFMVVVFIFGFTR